MRKLIASLFLVLLALASSPIAEAQSYSGISCSVTENTTYGNPWLCEVCTVNVPLYYYVWGFPVFLGYAGYTCWACTSPQGDTGNCPNMV